VSDINFISQPSLLATKQNKCSTGLPYNIKKKLIALLYVGFNSYGTGKTRPPIFGLGITITNVITPNILRVIEVTYRNFSFMQHFSQSILMKIIKIVATKCHILRQNASNLFQHQTHRWRANSVPQTSCTSEEKLLIRKERKRKGRKEQKERKRKRGKRIKKVKEKRERKFATVLSFYLR